MHWVISSMLNLFAGCVIWALMRFVTTTANQGTLPQLLQFTQRSLLQVGLGLVSKAQVLKGQSCCCHHCQLLLPLTNHSLLLLPVLTAQFGSRAMRVGVSPLYSPFTPSCFTMPCKPPAQQNAGSVHKTTHGVTNHAQSGDHTGPAY